MKKRIFLFATTLSLLLSVGQACAQLDPQGNFFLLPANPTSADTLTLTASRRCSNLLLYQANAYRVSMSQNNITVMRGEIAVQPVPNPCPPGAMRDEMDLGRLPAGNYTLTVINSAIGSTPATTEFSNAPFTISDGRLLKTAPYVRLDYSGHWWDPNDPGWGLFIWHDARDNVLAAWFTYGVDGKPIWYVFQPTWQTFAATVTTTLRQTSRAPGTTSPPPNPTTYVTVGTASLDFTSFTTADAGTLTYTFTGGPTTVRNIQRFKP